MRTSIAIATVLCVCVPVHAKKNRAETIPAVANAKVIGVHCDAGEHIVGVNECQSIIEELRSSTHLTVRNCPTVLDSNQEAHVKCLPTDDADLVLDVSRTFSGTPEKDAFWGFLASVQDTAILSKTYCDAELMGLFKTNADAVKCVADGAANFIFLHDGEAQDLCTKATDAKTLKNCKKNGL